MFLNVAAHNGLGAGSYYSNLAAVATGLGAGPWAYQLLATRPDLTSTFAGNREGDLDAVTVYDIQNGVTLRNRGMNSNINYISLGQMRKRKRPRGAKGKVPEDLLGQPRSKRRNLNTGPEGDSESVDDIARLRALAQP